MHIHFIGIGGIGVSALAQVALVQGHRVSGSDLNTDPASNPAIVRLQEGGAVIFSQHEASNLVSEVALVVATAAVGNSNPEVAEALRRGVRVVSRAAFLGELMAAHKGPKIAVAGTHGKTTTTAMLGVLLQEAGLEPTVFVGGEVPQLGGNVCIGSKDGPFVAEACEAYNSFLYLSSDIAIVTNVESDHLDHFGTEARLIAGFQQFLAGVPVGEGAVVYCGDDRGAVETIAGLTHPPHCIAYGSGSSLPSQAKAITPGQNPSFVWDYGGEIGRITLQVPGTHNVLNALAAATVGRLLHIPNSAIIAGLEAFLGSGRRQEKLGLVANRLVIDDYAHHPTEIRATLAAMRDAYPDRRIIAVFQPHLYSRTRDFLPEFAASLSAADVLLVTDVYAAREKPIAGVRAEDIVTLARQQKPNLPAEFVSDKNAIPQRLQALSLSGDLVLILGAGDIREQGEQFVRLLEESKT